MSQFDPENVERLDPIRYDDMRGTVHADDYDRLRTLWQIADKALQLSIVGRRKDQTFDNECEEYWISASDYDALLALWKAQNERITELEEQIEDIAIEALGLDDL